MVSCPPWKRMPNLAETEDPAARRGDESENGRLDVVPDEVNRVEPIEDLPSEASQSISTVTSTKFESYRGPLPQPDALGEYERILPGAADRILSMAESQSRHRQAMQKEAMELSRLEISSAFNRANRGLNLGALVALAIVGGGAFMAHLGYAEAGGGVIGGTIVGLAATFVYGAKTRDRDVKSAEEQEEK